MINRFLSIFALALLLTGCAADHGDGDSPDRPGTGGVPVEFYISVPQPAGTRIGDPGSATGETVDWDRLTVIVAYRQKNTSSGDIDTDPQKMVYWDTFTRKEFEQTTEVVHANSTLTPILNDGADTGVRTFTMPLPTGKARVYGITYSSPDEADNAAYKDHLIDFEKTYLDNIAKDGADHNADILAWTIPNSYATTNGTVATMDVAKFLSVATGYAVNAKPGASSPYDLDIVKANDIEMKQYWSMTLHRLATKIDMQWDAQGAYEKGEYVDMVVDAFAYNGGASLADGDLGSGLVFPYTAIQTSGKTFAPLGGKATFYNTSPVSKRNGRSYHYFFTDLSRLARLDFNLTGTKTDPNGVTTTTPRDFAFNLCSNGSLLPATWYKINTKIRGNGQEQNIIGTNFNTGN